MSRLIAALLAVSLVACGGASDTGTNPPPPPAPPITRLVLEDTSALLFTGSAVPGQAFVAHAYDAEGHEVANPVLALRAGAGWTIRGDTVIAPTTEGRSTLTITATRPQQAAADWVHLQGTGSDTAASASMAVTAGIDLRAHHWAVSYICRFRGPGHDSPASGVQLDSFAVRGATVDSIRYADEVAAPDSGTDSPTWRWFRQTGTFAAIYYSGTLVAWRVDAMADTATFSGAHLDVGGEAPDTLFWRGRGNNPETGDWRWPSALADSTPRRYVEGGGYAATDKCDDGLSAPDTLWFDEAS